jgi:hypothetical protein
VIFNDIIGGKRKSYFPPITLLLLILALHFVLFHFSPHGYYDFYIQSKHKNAATVANWIDTNSKFLIFLTIPFISIPSWRLFKKSNFNYSEHLIVNVFLVSLAYLCLTSLCIFDLIFSSQVPTTIIGMPPLVILPFYFYYQVLQLYYLKKLKLLIRCFFAIILIYIFIALGLALLLGVSEYYFETNGIGWKVKTIRDW